MSLDFIYIYIIWHTVFVIKDDMILKLCKTGRTKCWYQLERRYLMIVALFCGKLLLCGGFFLPLSMFFGLDELVEKMVLSLRGSVMLGFGSLELEI